MSAVVLMFSLLRCSIVVLVIPMTLAACSGKHQAAASQVAVRVNGDEISVHQVNAQLARAANVAADARDAAKRQVVDGLVDTQLFVQQAIATKLDRDPDVLAALEASRHQILAQAYLQKGLAAQAKPSDDEVKKYYQENPALFSERRIYRLQEVATSLPPSRVDELEGQVRKSRELKDVVAWLRQGGFEVAANEAVRGAEQLPLTALTRISALHDGEMGVFVNENNVTVIQVIASQSQPLSEKDATPFVEQFLTNRRRDELARSELKKLRDSAKIEFVGEYAKSSAAPSQVPVSASMQPSDVTKSSAVEQGVKGLR